ncbi:TPA: Cas8a1 family CRISPR/Cas system-associated protein [Serratia marcescens]|uniref:Cas8a1 family CRISPR/Cas system-associated protein n=1 Tax=Serratia nevei TaxID=2703794 RepID=UPI00372F4D77
MVLFAEYALSLNCFTCTRRAVENFAAFIAEQNLYAVAVNTPSNVFIDSSNRVALCCYRSLVIPRAVFARLAERFAT